MAQMLPTVIRSAPPIGEPIVPYYMYRELTLRSDGSYFNFNANGSTYYNGGKGLSKYTPPDGGK